MSNSHAQGTPADGQRYFFHVGLLLLGVSIIGSNAFLMSPVLNNISESLHATIPQVAWSVSAYGGSTAFSGLFLTGLAQRMGYRATVLLSGFGLALGVLSTGLSQTWIVLIISQIVAGLSAGVLLPTLYSMASIVAPLGRESATLGVVISGWSLAMVAGVPLSAWITDLYSWRYAYYAVFGFSIFTTVAFYFLPKSGKGGAPTSLWRAFSVPLAKTMLLITLLYMISFYGVYTFLGTFIQRDLELSAGYAGFAVLFYGAGFGIAGLFLGNVVDKIGPSKILPPVLLMIAAIYLSFLLLSVSIKLLFAGCLVWGFANQIALNCLVSVLSRLDSEQRVRLMGIYSAVAYGGAMIAGLSFGQLFQLGGFHLLLITAWCLCFLSIPLAFHVMKKK